MGDEGKAASERYERAVAAQVGGDLAAAETLYREAVALGHVDAAADLGYVLDERGDTEGAAAAFRKAADGGHIPAMLDLAAMYAYEFHRLDDARELFQRAADRGDPRAMLVFGEFAWWSGDLRAAEEAYRQLADSGNPRGYLLLGYLFADAGRELPRALSAFRSAAQAGVEEAWTQVGWTLARLGEVEEAEAPLRRAYVGGGLVAGEVLHDVLRTLDRADEARAALKDVSERATRTVTMDYRDLLARLDGEAADREGLEAWMAKEYDHPAPLELAALQFDAARLAMVETRLELKIDFGDDEAIETLAELYVKTGRAEAARALREHVGGGDGAS